MTPKLTFHPAAVAGSPIFSILIPSWNNLPYLKCCVESIRKNSTFQHEIVVHVNEGRDGTLEWVRQQGLRGVQGGTADGGTTGKLGAGGHKLAGGRDSAGLGGLDDPPKGLFALQVVSQVSGGLDDPGQMHIFVSDAKRGILRFIPDRSPEPPEAPPLPGGWSTGGRAVPARLFSPGRSRALAIRMPRPRDHGSGQ